MINTIALIAASLGLLATGWAMRGISAKRQIANAEHDIDAYMEINKELLNGEIPALEARIDALMLEYCPDEMTDEQMKRWGENQVDAGDF